MLILFLLLCYFVSPQSLDISLKNIPTSTSDTNLEAQCFLLDSDGYYEKKSGEECSFNLYPESPLFSTTTCTTDSAGTCSITNILFKYTGNYRITVTAKGYNSQSSSSFTVSTGTNAFESMSISSSDENPYINSLFTISIEIKDSLGDITTEECTAYTIETGGSTITGAGPKSIQGSSSFSVSINSSGSKTLEITCSKIYATIVVNIVKMALKITSFTPPLTTSQSFSLTVGVYDYLGLTLQKTNGPYSITLSLSPSGTFTGILSDSTTSGIKEYKGLAISPSGTYKIIASSPDIDSATSDEFTIENQKVLKITSFTPPSKPLEKFSLTVGVFDISGQTLQISNGPYSITLSLSPIGVFTGTLTGSTTNGEVQFKDLSVSSSGTYTITAKSINILSATSKQFTTTSVEIVIIATPSKSIVKIYEKINIEVEVYKGNKLISDLIADIIIIEKNSEKFNGPEKIKTLNGKASFSLYFFETGSKVLQLFYGKVFTSLEITVNGLENPDIKCKKSSSSTICNDCVPGAILFDGICTCALNSLYSYDSRECLCNEGFKTVNDYCVKECQKFYSASEIVGKFSNDFSSVYLTFSKKPSENLPCEDFLILPRSLNLVKFKCIWENMITLTIRFNKLTQVKGLIIGINPFKLQKEISDCNFKIEQLDISISYNGELPTPLASIDAPDIFSLNCSSRDLRISTPNTGRDYEFKWSSTYSRSNSFITQLISSSKDSIIKLPIAKLTTGTLTIILTISSKSFKTFSKVTKIIELVSYPHLTVELSSGSMIKIKKSSNLSIRPKIKEGCGKSVYKYTWNYITKNVPLDFSQILTASSSSSLLIFKNTLEPGNSYEFKVSVTDEEATGSASTIVVVEESPLIISLSRSNGEIGNGEDFYLFSSVVDPDSESSVISYSWSCNEQASKCLEADGKTLLTTTDQDSILIEKSKLRVTALYVFNLEASTSTKSQSISVEIEVKAGIKGHIYLPKLMKKINIDSNLVVISKVSGLDLSTITWKVLTGQTLTLRQGYSFVMIPVNTLNNADTYEVQVTLIISGSELTSIYTFSTNSPGKCESLEYESLFSSEITLYGESCVDGDDSDYPLTYQFGVDYKETMLFVSSEISSNEYTFSIRPFVTKGYLKVCDSLYSCSISSTSISSRRYLDEVSDSFDADTSDLESIPSAIIYYSSIATEDTVEKMTKKLIEYIEGTIVDSGELDIISTSAYALFTSKTSVDTSQADTVITALIETLENIDFELTDSQVTSIYAVADSQIYLISTKSIRKLINIVRNRWISNRVPYSEITFSSTLFVTHLRGLQPDYTNLLVLGSTLNLTFPEQFLINTSHVIDVSLSKFYEEKSPIFELRVFFSGHYENFTLTLETPEIYTGEFSDALRIEYNSSEFSTDSTCQSIDYMGWTELSCKIKSLTDSRVELDLTQSSIFTLIELKDSSNIQSKYQSIIYLLLIAGIVFLLYIHFCDKNLITFRYKKKLLLLLYPVTSVMIPQQRPWRLLQALHLVSSQSLLLLLIGGMNLYYPQSGGFIIKNTSKSGICLCILQAYSITNMLIIFLTLHLKKIEYFVSIIDLIIIVFSYIGTIVIFFQDPETFIFNWIFGFMLYSSIDIIFIQFIYALILSKISQPYLNIDLNAKTCEPTNKLEYSEEVKININSEESNNFYKKADSDVNSDEFISSRRHNEENVIKSDIIEDENVSYSSNGNEEGYLEAEKQEEVKNEKEEVKNEKEEVKNEKKDDIMIKEYFNF